MVVAQNPAVPGNLELGFNRCGLQPICVRIIWSSGPQPLRQQGLVSWKTIFSTDQGLGRWLQDDSSALHLLCSLFYCFIFGYAGSSQLCGLPSSLGEQGLLSSCGMWAAHCGGFSCCGSRMFGLQQLWHVGPVFVAPGLQSTGSIVVAHGLSCSVACGIFTDQGLNPHLLHSQVDSLPLSHQGGPLLQSYRSMNIFTSDFYFSCIAIVRNPEVQYADQV